MFTLTITPKVGLPFVETFATAEDMSNAHRAYVVCDIPAAPAIDGIPCYARMNNNGDRTYYFA